MHKTLIRNGTIVTEDEMKQADVLIGVDGKIEQIAERIQDDREAEVIDATDCYLMPLLIDCHVHFREPGMEHKSTMESEGAAALSGGVGTVCEMPNTIPPTVTIEALADKVKRASHVPHVKIKFFFGITEKEHLEELKLLFESEEVEYEMLRLHVAGVKLYLDHSTGDQKVESSLLDEIFETCAKWKLPIVAHCEDPKMNEEAAKKIQETIKNRSGGSTSSAEIVSLHSAMRPPESEVKAIGDAIELVRKHRGPFHVAHLSTKGGVELVRKAKAEGLPVTCEAAPHHLLLTTDDYETLGALGKMNPPLRSMEDRNALWKGIADGTIDCVSTDHAPHTLEEKNIENPLEAPSGVPGVETMLPLLFSIASNHWPHPSSEKPSEKITYQDIVKVCSENPAKIFSIEKSEIAEGRRAQFSVISPKEKVTIQRESQKTHCGWSAYEGWALNESIERVVV